MTTGGAAVLFFAGLVVGQDAPPPVQTSTGPIATADADHFETQIRPLLIERCYECHSADAGMSEGDLSLDTAEATRRGGARGAGVVPGNIEASWIWRAVSYRDPRVQMPPDGKLAVEELESLRHWIESGAFDPRTESPSEPAPLPPPEHADPRTQHWAFLPPNVRPPPTVHDARIRDPLDARVAQSAIAHGLQLSDRASSASLLRRLYFDLTGLSPTAAEIERFLNDRRPDAVQRVIDRLLADPAYAERQSRFWMDYARYSDTKGYVFTQERVNANAYRYRDWLIRSFAADLPYDQFIRLQIAGDQVDGTNADGQLDAMGFLTLGQKFLLNQQLIIDDQIDAVSRTFLGLTLACARCHDHKFDPLTTSDYYAMYGVFANSRAAEDEPGPLRLVDAPSDELHDYPILLRGQAGNHGPVAPRRFIAALDRAGSSPFHQGSGRLELANRIAASDNPLTARVRVNRIWLNLFGQPLVSSPSDFGVRVETPDHLAVLDDLAVDFLEHQFSTKWILRRIASSHTYQQASDSGHSPDAENRWLTHARRRRRDLESWRDCMLQAADQLDRRLGGASDKGVAEGSSGRRTLYAYIDRQYLPSLFRAFDFPSADLHAPQRPYTTVPQQGLVLLNSPLVQLLSVQLSAAIDRNLSSPSTDEQFVTECFSRALGRTPTNDELLSSIALLDALNQTQEPSGDSPSGRWSYGAARIADDGRPQDFRPLPHFTDEHYQGLGALPDPVFDWCSLSAEGGHPGTGKGLAAVRRWHAPSATKLRLSGTIKHPADAGNGIRATIVANNTVLSQWTIRHGEELYQEIDCEIPAGGTLDFVVDDNGEIDSDSFRWEISLQQRDDAWTRTARTDFRGPTAVPLSPREQLAQALLITNEFLFVD